MTRSSTVLIAFALAACGGSSTTDAGEVDAGTATDLGADATADAGPVMRDAGPPPTPITLPPLPAANAVPESDPNYQGQLRFLHDTWGIENDDGWPPIDFMLALQTSEPAVFGNQYASFGFVHDPTDDMPVGLKRGILDPTKTGSTCALCHVDVLPDGRVWLGAPNESLDLGRFQVEVSHRWVAAGNPALMTPLEESKLLALGPGRASSEGRSNTYPVPAQYPPYYNFQNRTNFTYLGAVSDLRSTIFVTVFDSGAGFPNDREAVIPWPGDARVEEMVAFLGSLHGPPAPPQDPTMVAAGQAVFASAHCSSCHHVDDPSMDAVVAVDVADGGVERLPGDDPSFPNGSVRTDPDDFNLIGGDGPPDPRVVDRLNFISRHGLHVGLSNGYRSVGLKDVWSTGPYLHNGSVPTLEALLQPAAARPTMVTEGTFTLDTTQQGNRNVGHEFGTTLSDADKTALVAYLRSL